MTQTSEGPPPRVRAGQPLHFHLWLVHCQHVAFHVASGGGAPHLQHAGGRGECEGPRGDFTAGDGRGITSALTTWREHCHLEPGKLGWALCLGGRKEFGKNRTHACLLPLVGSVHLLPRRNCASRVLSWAGSSEGKRKQRRTYSHLQWETDLSGSLNSSFRLEHPCKQLMFN